MAGRLEACGRPGVLVVIAGALAVSLAGTARADGSSQAPALPAAACAVGAHPACSGDCSPGETCAPDGGAPVCACQPEAAPCSGCGPGPHFVDACGPFPPIRSDLTGDHALIARIDLNLDCVKDIEVVLHPCAPPDGILRADQLQGPLDDSILFPGYRPIDGHLDVIDTELVSMCLTGGGLTLVAGAGSPASLPLAPSRGAVGELPSDPTLAESFYDLFFELQGAGGGSMYNVTPFRVHSQIACLPPSASYDGWTGPCHPLYTAGVCADGPQAGSPCIYFEDCPESVCTGSHSGNLIGAMHAVNEPVCEPGSATCDGNCPSGELCQPGPSGCFCGPPPCEITSAPLCGGTCAPGSICVPGATEQCQCVSSACEHSSWPQCGGDCPPELFCQPDAAGLDQCQCLPPPCSWTSAPDCGGACSEGAVCAQNAFGSCSCVLSQPCDGTAPACNGLCPPGQACSPAVGGGCQCCSPTWPTDPVDGALWTDKQTMVWTPHGLPCAAWYNVYKLTAASMPDGDDNGLADHYGFPSQCALPGATATEPGAPAAGDVEYYQVTVEGPGGEGPMGLASNGLARANWTPCP